MKGNLKCPCGKCSGELDSNLLSLLSLVEKQMGKELSVNSGYRCPSYNLSVGGVTNSAHTKGLAVDLSIDNSIDRYRLIQVLIWMDVKRIGIGKTFVHLDMDDSLPQRVLWLY